MLLPSLFSGKTERSGGTCVTQRHAMRQTYSCSQLHQSLIAVSRIIFRQYSFQLLFRLPPNCLCLDVPFPCENPGQYPEDIAIHCRTALPSCNGCYRTGGIGANARQGNQFLPGTGHHAAILVTDHPCRLLQTACTGIISQAFPQLEQLLLRHLCQCLYGGQCLHKSFKIRNHCLHPGLLQHNLRNPYRIWIGSPSPGQIPVPLMIPCAQGFQHLRQPLLLRHFCGFAATKIITDRG